MDVSEEVRAAAKRIARWEACCKTGDVGEHEYFNEPDRQWNDESPVIDWAVARIEADDAEQAERDRPIDEEWCLGLPGAEKHSCGMRFALPPHGGYPTAIVWNDGWCFILQANDIADFDDESCVQVPCATRGQLLDLLAALKGGAK